MMPQGPPSLALTGISSGLSPNADGRPKPAGVSLQLRRRPERSDRDTSAPLCLSVWVSNSLKPGMFQTEPLVSFAPKSSPPADLPISGW